MQTDETEFGDIGHLGRTFPGTKSGKSKKRKEKNYCSF